jgi:hypothetical protein
MRRSQSLLLLLPLLSFGIVAIESILDSREALASNKECKSDTVDESLCVIGIPDLDFKDKQS